MNPLDAGEMCVWDADEVQFSNYISHQQRVEVTLIIQS